jgi:hypothetical protein
MLRVTWEDKGGDELKEVLALLTQFVDHLLQTP